MTHKKHKWLFLSLIILAGATAWIIYDNATAPYQKMEGHIFGTTYHITYQSSAKFDNDIILQLNNVDKSLSAFNPQSIVSHINRNEKVELDNMFIEVFNLAQEISRDTKGAFDITVAPLVNLWGFGFKNSDSVTQQKIDSIMPYVGYQKVELQKKRIIKKHPQTMLDFSAIAKGYGCDVVANLLESRGVNNYMIEIGGEIRAQGKNASKKQWTLGITKPVEDSTAQQMQEQIQSVLSMPKMAIATSGNYRNFYYKDGKKYAHTINPSTGTPVEHNLLSATVVAPTCAMADAYATAFMVMGINKAKEILNDNNKIKAYFIFYDNSGKYQTWCSESLKKYIDK